MSVPKVVLIPENDPSLDLCLSLNPPTVKKEEEEPKEIFRCMYCDKEFTKSQALGGHQNSHKYERAQRQKALKMANGESGILTSVYPYGSLMPSLYGSIYSPVGVDMSAMIHKPYPVRFGYGGQGMSYMVMPNVTQSWQPNNGFQAVETNGYRHWTPMVSTNQGASSRSDGIDGSKCEFAGYGGSFSQ